MRVRHSWLGDLVQRCGLALSVGSSAENASLEQRAHQLLGRAALAQEGGGTGGQRLAGVLGREGPVEVEGQAEGLGEQLVVIGDQDAKRRHSRAPPRGGHPWRGPRAGKTCASFARIPLSGDWRQHAQVRRVRRRARDGISLLPWCAAPQRRKLVEFFPAHPRDHGKALRVSRYLTEEPHVRFSVWNADGVAEAAVSLEEAEAQRLAGFLAVPAPVRPRAVDRLLSLLPRG